MGAHHGHGPNLPPPLSANDWLLGLFTDSTMASLLYCLSVEAQVTLDNKEKIIPLGKIEPQQTHEKWYSCKGRRQGERDYEVGWQGDGDVGEDLEEDGGRGWIWSKYFVRNSQMVINITEKKW